MAETYPRRFLDSGNRAGLRIWLRNYQKDNDYICRGPVQGFTIMIHTPEEFPRTSQYLRVLINQEINVSVKPQMMITDEEIHGYTPKE